MVCFEKNMMYWVNITLTVVVTLSLFPLLQMKLSRKIQEVDSWYSMKFSSLQVDRKYPITHAERVATRFGTAIVLAIRDTSDRILKVFMRRRFNSAFSDEDLE